MAKAGSNGEIKVEYILEQAGFDFEREYEFEGLVASSGRPLRFDFAVFDDDGELDFLIEYQGEQHYQPKKAFGGYPGLQRQRFNDKAKKVYCEERKIPLVEIAYHEYNALDLNMILKRAGI